MTVTAAVEVRTRATALLSAESQTEVGTLPDDWDVLSIGDLRPFVTSGSRGWAKYYSDFGAAFLRITNLSRDSICPDLTDLKFVKLLAGQSEAERTQLQIGDVLISITADIGIIGYIDPQVPLPAYINQHIALVRFDPARTDNKFVSYFLASERPQKLFRNLTDQGAKSGMSLLTVRKIALAHPPIKEQRAIASTLSDVDTMIGALDKLIAKKRAIKLATMQQLLIGRIRLSGFSEAWTTRKIGDLLNYERPDKYIVKNTEYTEKGGVPVLTANKSFILGYTEEVFGIYNQLPVIVFDDFTRDSKYVDFPFKVKSSAIKLLTSKASNVNLRFVYESMRLIKDVVGDHKRYYLSEFRHHDLGLPSSLEQTAIVAVISDMDTEIISLEQRREKTRAIKQGMMQALLTGRIRLMEPVTA